ncbi:spore protease YyaC [Clostridium sp. D2Q-11]|uniref:Spore protease YyaC n=1 Tax=Anaeromonas frigoriresistens TaxID=2683708 RepID=A0A942Z9G1_9FIRM|nr:spore protease YyaC [Anaeromonas frigoriresistens]MBS4539288.1 spore protease YyaC [Anaeromonas frigoriresistens]
MIKINKNTIDCNSDFAISSFSHILQSKLIEKYNYVYSDLIILCIGTDRSTGDSLGPLVGYFLERRLFNSKDNVYVYGTLDSPVHAKNLDEYIMKINKDHLNPFIIAIDASLGTLERIGFISVWDGPLKPGAGVNKKLTEIGDIHITGVVNVSGFMEFMVLQNTRLNIVMKMANVISNSIIYSISKMRINTDALN